MKNERIMFADRIAAGAVMSYLLNEKTGAPDARGDSKHVFSALREFVAKAIVINADNVNRYMLGTDKEWDFKKDYPNLAPPFSDFFIEYNAVENDSGAKGVGVLFSAKYGDLDALSGEEGLWADVLAMAKESDVTLNTKVHLVHGIVLIEFDNVVYAVGEFAYCVGENGVPITECLCRPFSVQGKDAASNMAHCVIPTLLTISFIHCKNVSQKEVQPSKGLSKAYKKRTGKPLCRYRVLQIDAMKEVLADEGGSGHNGIKKALHICRGHFATYTPEKGFLGRAIESPITVWKPSHVRGNKKHGIAVKDYSVSVGA